VVTRFLDDKLIHAPISAEPQNILDCGYGQAEWAMAVAGKYPYCEVTGIDIHTLDLTDIPHNLNLECEDLNSRLTELYPLNHYDVIHSSFVSNGIFRSGWSSYIQELTQ
jgi:methylase of polypeptide subunit release factors